MVQTVNKVGIKSALTIQKIKINIGVPEKRELFGEKEEQRYECRGDFVYTKIKTNHKSDWFLFGGRGWIRTTEAE